MPCQRVYTSGYTTGSVLNRTVTPAGTRSSIPDFRVIGPVKYAAVPVRESAASTTRPPPRREA
jgi:hypothetical protein